MTNMQKESLADLLKWRRELVSQRDEIEKRISLLDELINDHECGSSRAELTVIQPRSMVETKQRRVRGVLAAARRAIDQFSGPFTKNELRAKLKEDAEFAGKEITLSNIQNAIRSLKEIGLIRVESEATATRCATYVKAA
jgi:hypothetical protein